MGKKISYSFYFFIIIASISSVYAADDCDPFGFGDGTPCPPAPVAPAATPTQPTTTPQTPTEFSIPLSTPLGTLNLIPFTDTSQTPAATGFKVKLTKPGQKLTVGPATIDDGEISIGSGKISMTGHLTIFGKQARFGIKDIDFQAKKRLIKRVVLTAQPVTDSATLDLAPGVTIPLGNIDITLEQGKPPLVQTHVKTDTLMPFVNSGIPVLNTLKFTNLDVTAGVTKGTNNKLTKTIMVKGDTEILGVKVSTVIQEVQDAQGKPGIYVNAPLPNNWKFSDSIKELHGTFFDALIFNQASFLMCTVDYTDPDKNILVKKGINFYAQVPLAGALEPVGKFIGSTNQTFTMYGKMDSNPHNLSLGIILSKGVPLTTSTVSVGNLEVAITGEPHLGLKSSVIVRPSAADMLTFSGEFALDKTTATLDASMDGTWNNPLGLKGLMLQDVALKLGIKYGTPVPSLFGLAAGMQIRGDTINFAAVADAGLAHMAFKGHIDRLSFTDIITAFAQPLGAKLPSPPFPIVDLTNVDIRFAATDTTIGTQTIAQGITMIADMNILSEKANVNVNVDTMGIKLFGSIDPINIANLLKINGHNGAGKPEVDIELSLLRQNFLIQGELSLADLYKTATFITITTSGIEFDFLDSIGKNNLLYSHVHGKSSGGLDRPQFTVSIDFQNQLQQYIKDQVNQQLAIAQHQVIDGINNAQKQLDTLKTAQADANKRIHDARNQVTQAQQALDAINNAQAKSNEAFTNAQKDVNTIQGEIDSLKSWYYGLPKI